MGRGGAVQGGGWEVMGGEKKRERGRRDQDGEGTTKRGGTGRGGASGKGGPGAKVTAP